MTPLFDDIVFKVRGREYAYHAHTLETNEATHSGFATAALVAVWMLGTDEAAQRGLTSLDTPEERLQLMNRYEAETFREDGGLLMRETEALYWWLWHIDLVNTDETPSATKRTASYENETLRYEDVDDNQILELGYRQQDLWSKLINEYMTRLVDRWAAAALAAEDTIVDCESYLDYLLGHLAAYSRIQRMREVRWCDRFSVEEFWTLSDSEPHWIIDYIDIKDIITHLPADVDEPALMERYFTLRQTEHAQRKSKPSAADWFAAEQQPLDAEEIIPYLSAHQQSELQEYHRRWLRYLSHQLKLIVGSQVPSIWTDKVNDKLEEKLIAYLTIQEGTHAWARNTCAAIFAMQQIHWVKADLSVSDYRQWAGKHLQRPYSTEATRVALSRWWYGWSKEDDTITLHIRRLREM